MEGSEEKLVTVSFSDHLKWYMDTIKNITLTDNSNTAVTNHIMNVTLSIENITLK